jgi:hypothetical protein
LDVGKKGAIMDVKTLVDIEALVKSKRKWQNVLAGAQEDGRHDCPLCKLYYDASSDCKGCPISEFVGFEDCAGTPYEEWLAHQKETHRVYDRKVRCHRCASIAKSELEFLDSVLFALLHQARHDLEAKIDQKPEPEELLRFSIYLDGVHQLTSTGRCLAIENNTFCVCGIDKDGLTRYEHCDMSQFPTDNLGRIKLDEPKEA